MCMCALVPEVMPPLRGAHSASVCCTPLLEMMPPLRRGSLSGCVSTSCTRPKRRHEVSSKKDIEDKVPGCNGPEQLKQHVLGPSLGSKTKHQDTIDLINWNGLY